MKSIVRTILFVLSLFLTTSGQAQMKMPKNAADQFTRFIKKDKFLPEEFYTGVSDSTMRSMLVENINKAANDFQTLAKTNHATEKDYQKQIKVSLERFAGIYDKIDTEDRERICLYFEELMDIVGLESSGGALNTFMYGFDPTKVKPTK